MLWMLPCAASDPVTRTTTTMFERAWRRSVRCSGRRWSRRVRSGEACCGASGDGVHSAEPGW